MRKSMLCILLLAALTTKAQDNFTYTPEKPKPGDVIKFHYVPGNDLAGITKLPAAFFMESGNKRNRITDIPLKRENGKLVGSIKTDTAAAFIAFGFTSDNKYDNNGNDGFWIQLYDGDKPRINSNGYTGNYYNSFAEQRFGTARSVKKALAWYQKEMELYPQNKDQYTVPYLSSLYQDDKDAATAAIQSEIENTIKGLKEEKDYTKLVQLYNILGLRQQRMFFSKLKSEKFSSTAKKASPQGFYEKFMAEKDAAKKQAILDETIVAAATDAENKESYTGLINYFNRTLATACIDKKDWDGFRKMAARITDNTSKYGLYNSIAWKLQETNTNLPLAEELSKAATTWAKNEWTKPTGKKPDMSTMQEWEKERKNEYAQTADTYGMVLYRLGEYKKGLPFARESAIVINEGQSADLNNTYALLAQKALPAKQYQPQLEQFVKDGKATPGIKGILKDLYKQQNSNGDTGFDTYITALEKEAENKKIADLKKSILNKPAPPFTLNDSKGNTVSLADLKGNVVIVDFWATWCGPCKASFPGMQKIVTKYKDDPNVKILFVNTWETADDKPKAVNDFIAKNNYSFQVLMDLNDKVVKDYGVDGIPTKFIIGKDGNIKFKSVGFDGEDAILKELPTMIQLAD